jgi:hypothetical protein
VERDAVVWGSEMNFRELLQTAFWSKKTLLRMLIGFGFLLVAIALVAGVWYETDLHWITPGERNAGRTVLAQIDSLQNLELISRQDFEARESGLQERLDAAHEVAWTLRDKVVNWELFGYLRETERARAEVWKQNQMQPGGPSITSSDRELNRKAIATDKENVQFYRLILHKQLD